MAENRVTARVAFQAGCQQVTLQVCDMKAPEFSLCLDYSYVFNLGPYMALTF